jgi:dienelactone hydrolase
VLWLKGAKSSDGKPLNTGSVFALSRLSSPLVANSKSTIGAVDDLTAGLLEPLRVETQKAMAAADHLMIPREDVLLAWTFKTHSLTNELPELRKKPVDWNLPTAIGAVVEFDLTAVKALADNPLVGIGSAAYSDILWMKEGELISGNAMDPNASETNTDVTPNVVRSTEGSFTAETLTTPRQEARRFSLIAPKTSKKAGGKVPVVIFQHGLNGSRREALFIANTFAKGGYAVLAIDAPFHGDRSYCTQNADCRGGSTCDSNHRCTDDLNDPNDGYQYGNIGPFSNPIKTPVISGNQFLSTTNLFASRDHFRQQVIDIAQLIRVLQNTTDGIGAIPIDNPDTMGVTETLDVENPRYVGQSLGGIMGALISAAIPEIPASTLNVPGASLTDILLGSQAFASRKQALDLYLASRGMPAGSDAYFQFLDIARWILDPADPQNYGRHLIAEPFQDLVAQQPGPRKRIFISWVKNDEVIPNSTTTLLIRSIDAAAAPANFKEKQYPSGGHTFMVQNVVTNPNLAFASQQEALEWVDQ